jgi:hypothetical protein
MKNWNRALEAANKRMIDNWLIEAKRLWSMRLAAINIVIGAVILVAPLVADELKALIGVWPFAIGLILASIQFGFARLLKQPGAGDQ